MNLAFGEFNVAPSAMLSGVYSVENIMSAQADGLLIFWSHRVEDLGAFLKFNEVMNVGDVARASRAASIGNARLFLMSRQRARELSIKSSSILNHQHLAMFTAIAFNGQTWLVMRSD